MKTKILSAFVAVISIVVFTSCEDSSFVGFNPAEMISSLPTSEDSENSETSEISETSDIPDTPDTTDTPETEVEKILPDFWGKIVGVGISAVPADDVRGAYAKKCMVIRCEYGAVAVTFDIDEIVPDKEAIINGYFVEGNFNAEYNGGLYVEDHWEPAISKDMSDRIAYYVDDTCKRNIRNSTLKLWNWRDGNWSTVIDGYSFVVDNNGVVSISYEGELYEFFR